MPPYPKPQGPTMSDGYAADEPRHVELAQIDEDVRRMAILGARSSIKWLTVPDKDGKFSAERLRTAVNTQANWDRFSRALRVLRHFGLLVEHGDGVVSVKETPNG